MSAFTLVWFEAVCAELERNPKEATEAISEFREQDYALEACHTWMLSPECSAKAKFYLALVLQYSSMKNWTHLSTETTQSLRDILWGLICNGATEDFALNKIIQVYALLVKRGWCALNEHQQQHILEQIGAMFATAGSSSTNPKAYLIGIKLIVSLVEEFESRSTTEIGLPLEFHMQAHVAFETFGLDECFRLAQMCFNGFSDQLRGQTSATDVAGSTITLISESVRLCVELLNWTFDSVQRSTSSRSLSSTNLSSKNSISTNSQILVLPRKWSTVLLPDVFIENIFNIYIYLREMYVAQAHASTGSSSGFSTGTNQLTLCHSCLTELRVLMLSMASISGSNFFDNDDERIMHGDRIFKAMSPLLIQSITTGTSAVGKTDVQSYALLDLCSDESTGFSSILLRLIGNFKIDVCIRMSAFKTTLGTIGQACFVLGQTTAVRAQSNTAIILGGSRVDDDDYLLSGSWQGDALVHLLDALCIVLDSTLYIDSDQYRNPEIIDIRNIIREMSSQVFIQVFECYLHSTIWEALSSQDEEEDEEEEGIHARTHNDLLTTVCTLGRVGMSASMDYIIYTIQTALVTAEGIVVAPSDSAAGSLQQRSIYSLEIFRICSLFATHILVEDFQNDINSQIGMDTPTIPQLILEEAKYSPQETHAKIWGIFWQNMRVLQMQTQLLTSSDSVMRYHPLVSSYLLQYIFRFFREFFSRYIFPDVALYSTSYSGSALFYPPDTDFINTIEQLISASHTFVQYIPLEIEVISIISHMITTMTKCATGNLAPTILRFTSTTDLFCTVTDTAVVPCALNLEGLSLMFRSLSNLTVSGKNEVCFIQLCSHIQSNMQKLQECTSKEMIRHVDKQLIFEKCMASLRGLAHAPTGMNKILRQLFDYCLPVITQCLSAYGSDADEVVTGALLVLCDYAEHKLDSLPQVSSLTLYRASLSTLQLLVTRIQTPLSAVVLQSKIALEEEESWRNKILLLSLQLLNHLADKDFSLEYEEDDDLINDAIPTDGKSADQEVADVLIFGFQALVPTITDSLLRSYPQLCDRYFALIAFVYNAYSDRLSVHLAAATGGAGQQFLSTLMEHLLWAAGSAVEPTAARLALQSIQVMASLQLQLVQRGSGGIGLDLSLSTLLFERAVDRLLEIIFFPKSAEYGIQWDRVDACGNALITLVALNSTRFLQTANAIVQQLATKHVSVQQALFDCFNKLTTARNVNMTTVDRVNKRTFCENFRDFIQEIRPLINV